MGGVAALLNLLLDRGNDRRAVSRIVDYLSLDLARIDPPAATITPNLM
jgi:hypothetical protein